LVATMLVQGLTRNDNRLNWSFVSKHNRSK
jgi:hypothetical protein